MNNIKAIYKPANWYRNDITSSNDWIYHFTDSEINELKQALVKIKKTNLSVSALKKEDFQLPLLSKKLKDFGDEIKFGRGFKVLRGFSSLDYSQEDAALLFFGVCLYFGVPVPQSSNKELVYYVRDLKKDDAKRYIETNSRLPFHTDGSDIISLFCYSTTQQGGLSRFVSSVTVFDEMLKKDSQLAEVLTVPLHPEMSLGRNFAVDFSEYEKVIPFTLPIFNCINEMPVNRYAAGYITSALKRKTVASLTEEQIQALTLLNEVANDEKFNISLKLEAGDMEFFNNNFIFHARDEFQDGEDTESQRVMIRIWLDAPEVQSIPPLFGY